LEQERVFRAKEIVADIEEQSRVKISEWEKITFPNEFIAPTKTPKIIPSTENKLSWGEKLKTIWGVITQ
jgi:hypothetical protein